jgi:hypothetical protein
MPPGAWKPTRNWHSEPQTNTAKEPPQGGSFAYRQSGFATLSSFSLTAL